MQNQVKNLLKGVLIYGFGNVSVKLIGLILLRLYTDPKILTVDEFATLGILESTSLIVISLFSLSLYSAYIRWYWDKEFIPRRKSILFSCFAILIAIGVLLSASGFVFSKTLSFLLFDKGTYSFPLSLMFLAAALQLLIDLTLSQMRIEEKPTHYIVTNLVRLVTTLFATIYLLKYAHHGLAGIYEAMLLGNIVFIAITIPYILKRVEAKFTIPVVKEMLRFSLPLALASISGVLLAQFDRYVLNFRSTVLNLGLYTLGYKIANTTKILVVNSIQIALTPTYFKLMNNPEHKSIYPRIMVWFTVVVVYVSIFLSLFGMEVTKIFSKGLVYWDAYKVIPILSLGIVFAMLKDSSSIGLQITKKTKIIGVVLSAIAALNLALNVLLIPYFGAIGAACSSLTSQIVYFIVIFAFAQKHYFIPYRLDKVIVIIIVGLVLVISGYFFNSYSLGLRVIVKSILLILFPVLLFVFRIFEKNEIETIKSFILNIKNTFSPSASKEIDEQISEYNE